VQVDSRRIEEGDLFVAVGDGAAYTKHAFARGAAATVVPDEPFAALAAIAGAVRDRSGARFVAITGSMGKTSTKDILAAICAAQPSGGTAVVPADFAVRRTEIDVVRVGEDARLESFDPPLLRTSVGATEVNFSAQHLAVNAVSALATARVLGLEIPARLDVTFAEWRNQELPLPGGGLLVND